MNTSRKPSRNSQSDPVSGAPATGIDGERGRVKIDQKRFRRVRRFFFGVLARVLFWDVLCAFPILRWIRSPAIVRWQGIARGYRQLAMEMGGVLIKLGQFLSTRVDLLPPAVTRELAGLQDEVAPAGADDVIRQTEADFGRPLSEVFQHFCPEPMGAASLAQAHKAVLFSGETVVLKILRPGISRLVETDLAVLGLICRWLNRFRNIRNRMDLDRLLEEFTDTTRRELDLMREKDSIRRFAADFKDDEHVYLPRVYDAYCAPRTLTLEDVSYIKIDDTPAIAGCGISLPQVAERLYNIYMVQMFSTSFAHVDPHPGNLFVRPLPDAGEIKNGVEAFAPGEKVPFLQGRPFQIVFIDFGMTAVISDRLKAALRMGAIGIGTRDARKVIQAYIVAGALRPGADLRRLEEAHEDWFRRLWGIRMGKIQEVAFKEIQYFMREYRQLITDAPFQIQGEMLFVGRALGILAGMATRIDPDFDPWRQMVPWARRFAAEELKTGWHGLPEEVAILGSHLLKIPTHLDQVLTKARQGSLAVLVSLSPETRRAIRRIDLSVKRFSWMVLAAGLLVSAVNLYIAGKERALWIVSLVLATVAFLWGIRKR
jgi:predicted unusual protein kinase regulating ubiquinone biosynthesis (AarF/ABC1/UbiB family)